MSCMHHFSRNTSISAYEKTSEYACTSEAFKRLKWLYGRKVMYLSRIVLDPYAHCFDLIRQ
jgi:hypothetical protein